MMPVDLFDNRVRRWIQNETLVCRICLLAWVERDPDFRVIFPYGGYQDVPAILRYRLCFLHPRHVNAFCRLDFLRVVLDTLEQEFRSVRSYDAGFLDLVIPVKPEDVHLLAEELMDGIGDGKLCFTCAQDTKLP